MSENKYYVGQELQRGNEQHIIKLFHFDSVVLANYDKKTLLVYKTAHLDTYFKIPVLKCWGNIAENTWLECRDKMLWFRDCKSDESVCGMLIYCYEGSPYPYLRFNVDDGRTDWYSDCSVYNDMGERA